MPHVSEYRVQPDHDGHDRLLVAALAADDLVGADRDHALQLTRSCAGCASLHDDLVAIARATAVVPPVATRPRDFQLTPADAARLQPNGWRRLLGAFATAPALASRQLGAGLAALGLVGLLIGNAPALSIGTASAPAPMSGAGAAAMPAPAASSAARDQTALSPVGSAAASAAAGGEAYGTVDAASAPAASSGSVVDGTASGSIRPTENDSLGAAGGAGPAATDAVKAPLAETGGDVPAGRGSAVDANPFRPLNVLFAVAVLAGVAILVRSSLRARPRG